MDKTDKDKQNKINEIETLAEEVLDLKNDLGLRKPIVIEFCGTPKSGKTTSITALNIFLKRNKFRTTVIQEKAAICPVRNKTDYFFNSWTMFASLCETIEQLSVRKSSVDVILVDRSIYDALCWFEWLHTYPNNNPYIDSSQYNCFKNFLLSCNMWTSIFDITYIFKTDPDKSLEREYAELLTSRGGSIMNEKVLEEFNQSMIVVKEKYGKRFKKLEEYNTSTQTANIVNYEITKQILLSIKDVLTEKIAYYLDTLTLFLHKGVNKNIGILEKPLQYGQRSFVEKEPYIQPIPVAVITNKERNKVLVLKKNDNKTEKASPEHKKLLLYLGGHVRIEDENENCKYKRDIFRNALYREIREELNESISIPDIDPFMIYVADNEKSKKHLAICYVIEMDLEYKEFRPTQTEFIYSNKKTISGTVIEVADLNKLIRKGDEELESWSEYILGEVFGQAYQPSLFDKLLPDLL